MNYKKINDATRNLDTLRNTKAVYEEENEDGEKFEVYDIGLENGVFLKLEIVEDSYEENEYVYGFEFVQAQEKTITVYEYKS